jgi:hypothetical protein
VRLPGVEASEAEVREWVAYQMTVIDETPRHPRWRYRAAGPMGEALADAPRSFRLNLRVPVGEMRVLRDVAASRGIGADTLARRAIGTWLVAVGEVDPAALPYFCRGGLVR